jgi:hypothetical protein
MDYDYNFDRFLHYFLGTITQQQKSAKKYKMKQEVLGIIVLTQPYTITQKTGEPIQDCVMKLDFNLKNLNDETIKIWGHNLKFLNPHPKYQDKSIPSNYQDWLDLIRQSVQKDVAYTLNLNNPGISKAVDLVDYENITPEELEKAKKTEGRKIMRKILEEKLKEKEKIIEQNKQELEQKDYELQQQAELIKKLQVQLKKQ